MLAEAFAAQQQQVQQHAQQQQQQGQGQQGGYVPVIDPQIEAQMEVPRANTIDPNISSERFEPPVQATQESSGR
ncbi:hypothetical protein CONPUDRAFT_83646 [Coniophora puteana RWD-64-598 SS2]|uniref:Uncharacterized protein n=1 Tax=Coniophora puteana (strain RWD-64-598) TaxID=741705 RepID=A0A5M3MKE5_CONPW|nr:uncharacterized protein CONPUDRAFT_83646 [Coniophora puteana RWD-64-598 SS2]EIW79430.1 hypothetical protein CONPUDRAFT_83646 [Coniophora puteana RWD-64-598 SS2]